MKTIKLLPVLTVMLLLAIPAGATTFYVDAGNASPAAPFTDWSTAATNIQDAIDVATDGDQVWVTNGIYLSGGKVMAGDLTNRVALDKVVTVESVNGPWVTTILGAGATNGAAAVRCAWLTNGAALVGFTLQSGATRNSGDTTTLQKGGGIWCASSNAIVANCVIQSNTAYSGGGGIFQGAIKNCLVSRNSANSVSGFAVVNAVMTSCTVVSNLTYGVTGGNYTNCILYHNATANNQAAGTMAFCCTTFSAGGPGSISAAPQLFADGAHLTPASPCIGTGTNLVTGTDIFGRAWANPPSIGCAEWQPTPVVTKPQLQLTSNPIGFTVGNSAVTGPSPFTYSWLKDGAALSDDGHLSGTQTTNLVATGVSFADTGNYQLVVSNAFGVVTSAVAQLVIHTVDAAGSNPISPYLTWGTAATNIQDAITASAAGEIVLVTNGVYAYGGKVMAGDLTNRIALDKALLVQSLNGPVATIIQGAGVTNGLAAVRCAWLTNGAVLSGFTLTGGATRASGDLYNLRTGGGVWCASIQSVIVNCLITSNFASYYAGGVYNGNLRNCAVYGNTAADGGGSYASVMNDCTVTKNLGTFGGGVNSVRLTNCIVYSNSGGNHSGCILSYCCTTPLPTGIGNISTDPQLFVDNIHLTSISPCRGAGTNAASPSDIYGRSWSNPPSMGCAEWQSAPVVGQLTFQLNGNGGLTINVPAAGQPPFGCSWTRNGTPIQAGSGFGSVQTTSLLVENVNLLVGASYQAVVTNAYGMATSSATVFPIHCVDAAGTNPVSPYLTWATAATNIQDAITASAAGEMVLVTNGLYASGGKSMDGVITNRISLDKAILVQSVNGPSASIIQGAWDPTSTNGPAAVRCAWLTNSASLSGFTLQGGATRIATGSANQSVEGGGVLGTSNNAVVCNCIIRTNWGSYVAGGAFAVTLIRCMLVGNQVGLSGNSGSGGGAVNCNLQNCLVISNSSTRGGGGIYNCKATNCLFTQNYAVQNGSAANLGSLVGCTVTKNTVGSGGNGGAVASVGLTNCIVYGNYKLGSGSTNYYSCTFTYSDTEPLPAGTGNLNVNPQLLADGIHLAVTSPCLGAGTTNAVSGTDIDGQAWSNPPSMGCDEWQPAPVISVPLVYQANLPAHNFAFSVIVAGQSPFAFFWGKDGTPIQDDSHYSNSGTATLVVNHFGLDDVGTYQVVVSNAFGVVTSQVAQVVMHAVDIASQNPVAPYSTWATAATNIQDAINTAAAGDIVLVTNGVYAVGGKVMAGDLTNRVALDRAVAVSSVNGYATTIIQGAWDPASTNGPGSVRCAYLADGALLNGFTLRNGATRATGHIQDGPLESGGAVWCSSTNAIVSNCVLSNNIAFYGGGICFGTLNNSLVLFNVATYGGGAYNAVLNNCTVQNNFTSWGYSGAGTYGGITRNSIVQGNYANNQSIIRLNNYSASSFPASAQYFYSCTSPSYPGDSLPAGVGNIYVEPSLLGAFRISLNSLCRGAGSALYASGADLDGEPWAMPPSMGCDEGVLTNLVGPLSVNIRLFETNNVLVNRYAYFTGIITGDAAWVEWAVGDGQASTNLGSVCMHKWTNSGDYLVTFTAYNYDYPAGVSTNILMHVQPLNVPQLQAPVWLTNGFQFQFTGQLNADYTIQYTTSLAPPVVWQTLQTIRYNYAPLLQITDASPTNEARFYRVLVQ